MMGPILCTAGAVCAALISAPASWYLMRDLSGRACPGRKRMAWRIAGHAIVLATSFNLVGLLIPKSSLALTLMGVLFLLWMLAVMDAENKYVPESMIFTFATVCGLATVFGVSGTRMDVAMTGMVIVAATLGCVVKISALWAYLFKRPVRTTLGSGDTLVLLGLAAYMGMNVFYAVIFACVLICALRLLSLGSIFRSSDYFPFLPAIFAGALLTIILDYWLGIKRIESLNAVTQFILIHR